MNKVKLEYLEHRAKLNEKVLQTSADLAAVNKQLIEINRHIIDTNEDIVAFNARMIAENSAWIKNGLDVSSATPASNAQLIATNSVKIGEIAERSKENKIKMVKLYEETQKNREAILANSAQIAERRERIQENHAKSKHFFLEIYLTRIFLQLPTTKIWLLKCWPSFKRRRCKSVLGKRREERGSVKTWFTGQII